jgi:hypothetical protein
MIIKILKYLKWSLIVLFCVPVLIYLACLIGNLRHDPPTPALEKLMAFRPLQIEENSNAYFDVIGLAAPDNMEPHRWGVLWFEQANANDKIINGGGIAPPINLQRRTLPDTSKLPCSSKVAGHLCLKEIAADPSAARNTLAKEAQMLKHFDAILDRDFQEPFREMSILSEFAPLAPLSTASKLALIRIALEINQGRDNSALTRWGRETTFLLRQTKNSSDIVGKMIPIAMLNRYQKLLAEYIALHPDAAHARSKQILALLEPFSKDAVSMQTAFDNDVVVFSRFLLSPQINLSGGAYGEDGAETSTLFAKLVSPLLDRQATANEFSGKQMECSRVAALNGIEHINGITALIAHSDQPAALTGLLSFHNPIGNYMLSEAGTMYCSPYIYKSDDILANKQLLTWAIKLKTYKAISPEAITEDMQLNRAALEHPTTGELPVFDPQRRTLSYPVPKQLEITNYTPLEIKL